MKCMNCSRVISPERLSVLPKTRICTPCAMRAPVKKVKGRMIYEHKTAPTIEVMSEETFNDSRKYTPNFGMGSGVHVVSKPNSSL